MTPISPTRSWTSTKRIPSSGIGSSPMSSKRGGHQVGERRVWRLCRDQQVFSAAVRKGRSHRTPGPAVHDDHVQRDFTATNPDEVWLTDVTEHPTAEGKLHACVSRIRKSGSGRMLI
jgi:transposase InsO family protein